MDIAAMSLSLSACSTNTNISIAMMSKVLDTVEASGEALTEMIQAIPTQGLGEHIDVLA
ncbi:MAG: putative motility protein [Hungatella sp.]|nr:putative motility protein [Hungatella sp.]